MTKHTPAPWSYSVYKDTNHCKIYLHGLGRADKVAGADSLQGYCGEANARLIASAPELLEACELALESDDRAVKDVLRSAIAKAKGK